MISRGLKKKKSSYLQEISWLYPEGLENCDFFKGEIAWFASYGTLLQTVLLRDEKKKKKRVT